MTISINFNSTFHVSIIKIINFSIKTRHSWFIYFNFLFLPTSFSHNFTNLFSLSLNFIWHKFHKSKSCESNSSDLEVTNFTKFSYQTIQSIRSIKNEHGINSTRSEIKARLVVSKEQKCLFRYHSWSVDFPRHNRGFRKGGCGTRAARSNATDEK